MRKTNLERLSEQFADNVLKMLKNASVDELCQLLPQVRKLVEQRGREGNRALRAPRDTADVVRQVLEILPEHEAGLRSEELQRLLGVHAARMRLALVELVREGLVVRQGKARGVRYVIASGERSSGESSAEVEIDESILEQIRERLSASRVPMTAAGLEEVVGAPKETVRAALDKLATAGVATRLGAGRYRSTAGPASSGPRLLKRSPTPPPGVEPIVDLDVSAE